jgi:CheY-like chemotaxis protein
MGLSELSTLPLILLAEDDLDDILFMRRALKKAAVTNPVFVARDGQEAIDYLEGEALTLTSRPIPSQVCF